MTILLEPFTLPERGPVTIHLNQTFQINVTAAEAQRKVDDWLFDQVSYMMGAESPMLVIGRRIVWRVPAILTASHVGRVGTVGAVDVDVQTGEMDNTPECKEKLLQCARSMAEKLPPYQPRTELPDSYLAHDLAPTRRRGRPEGNPREQILAT